MENEEMVKKMLIGMQAETPIHVGAGESSGFVDIPFMRESTTSYPVIPGSGIKGAFKEKFEKSIDKSKIEILFGKEDNAGCLVFSDARLLLLPVRSLTDNYKWLTCPYIIERLNRDRSRLNNNAVEDLPINVGNVGKHTAICKGSKNLYLEERQFEIKNDDISGVVNLFKQFINPVSQKRLENQLAILSDDDFKWFAQYGLQVNARNVLDDNKTSKNLWYEETVPVDTIFYTLIFNRFNDGKECSMEEFSNVINTVPYIQVGGNETIGQGWFKILPIYG